MIYGLDTGFPVAAEVVEHPWHLAARDVLGRLVASGDTLALTPQVLAEFIHIVTDPRRFGHPLETSLAVALAENWSKANDVKMVFPGDGATRQLLLWLREHSLGRKRLLDTLLAATYLEAGVSSLLTTNPADFQVFGRFACVSPVSGKF